MVRAAMTRSGCGRGDPQCGIVTVLRQRVAVLEAEDQRVRAERDQLAGQVERLEVGNQQLRARIGELAWQVEELRRAGRRQAAPFSKDRPNPSPRRPGRKAGDAYAIQASGESTPCGVGRSKASPSLVSATSCPVPSSLALGTGRTPESSGLVGQSSSPIGAALSLTFKTSALLRHGGEDPRSCERRSARDGPRAGRIP
jgi:hypothetical protein